MGSISPAWREAPLAAEVPALGEEPVIIGHGTTLERPCWHAPVLVELQHVEEEDPQGVMLRKYPCVDGVGKEPGDT